MIYGLLLWSLVHLVPSLAPSVKKGWISMLGENGYTISFSAIVIFSLVMIVYGWRHSDPVVLYTLPIELKPVSLILMVVVFVLFGAAQYPTRIKTYLRHPQLTSIIVWSIAHLLVNGDSRSIIFVWQYGAVGGTGDYCNK
ncbi:MAG: NnrU family protein [Gammaproteobacteria bacterium]|nr:NnrU family protein [Gammaproteobacteria bacterium]MDX2488695.1 NnrU family protein [Gammaproteobacteria bacterium]